MAASVPVWTCAARWLDAVEVAADSAAGREVLAQITGVRTGGMRTSTLLAIARVDAASADHATGRGVSTSHRTVAARVAAVIGKCSEKTVQRARVWLERMGLAVEVERGRALNSDERRQAREAHGRRQTKIASLRALVLPREHAVAAAESKPNVHQPTLTRVGISRNDHDYLPTRERAEKRAPAKAGWRPTVALQRLAAAIVGRLPWLGAGHMWGLCRILAHANVDPQLWSAGDLVALIDQRNCRRGMYSLPVASQKNPRGLFACQLKDALTEVVEPPGQRRRRERAAQVAIREAEAAARQQVELERRDPIKAAVKRSLLDQLRKDLADTRRAVSGSALAGAVPA